MFGDELALAIGAEEKKEDLLPIAAPDNAIFAELQEPEPSASDSTDSVGAIICKDDICIEITDNVSDEFLLRILKAVSNA